MNGVNINNTYKPRIVQNVRAQILSSVNNAPISSLNGVLARYIDAIRSKEAISTDLISGVTAALNDADLSNFDPADLLPGSAAISENAYKGISGVITMYGAPCSGVFGEITSAHAIELTINGGVPAILYETVENLPSPSHPVNRLLYEIHMTVLIGGVTTDCIVASMITLDDQYVSSDINPVLLAGVIPGYTWFDFAFDLVSMDKTNGTIISVNEALCSGLVSLDWLRELRDSIKAKFITARRFINQVVNGWLAGGLKGAYAAVIQWVRGGSSVSSDESGYLKFTDNSALIPQQYLTGLLSAIAQTLAAIVQGVVNFFLRIAGALLNLLGAAVWSLFGSVAYDEAQTRAGINTSDKVLADWGPMSSYQFRAYLPSSSEIAVLLRANTGMMLLEVPFGYLLIGVAGEEANDALPCNCEFHPDMVNRLAGVDRIFAFTQLTVVSNMTVMTWSTVTREGWLNTLKSISDTEPGVTHSTNASNGSLTAEHDVALRKIVSANCFLGAMWCQLALQLATTDPTEDFRFNGSIYTNSTSVVDVDRMAWSTPSEPTFADLFLWCLVYAKPHRDYLHGNQVTWSDITSACAERSGNTDPADNPSMLSYLLENDIRLDGVPQGCGAAMNVYSTSEFAYHLPQYDASSFWTTVGVTITVCAITAIAAAVASTFVTKAMSMASARSAAQVEKKWDALKASPTAENAAAYRKAAKWHNLKTLVIGGSKYDTANYWNASSGQADANPMADSVVNQISLLDESQSDTDPLQDVITLIRGNAIV